MGFLIKNGLVINSDQRIEADVYIKDGKIEKVISREDSGYDEEIAGLDISETIDAEGRYVLPGAIDVHTHFNLPVSGTVSADDYFVGSKAAACGGVTTFFDYPTQEKGTSILKTLEDTIEAIKDEACIDYGIHVCITDLLEGRTLEDMKTALEMGVSSYKCYLVYPDIMVDLDTLGIILQGAKEAGAIINVHAEDFGMLTQNLEKLSKEGRLDAYGHYLSRDEKVESKAVKDIVELSGKLDAPLYVVHTAAKESLEYCMEARKKGYPVYVETCPHYLYFTSDVFKREDGVNYICSPPMKGEESKEALWKGLKDGFVDTVATDHCPFMLKEKAWGLKDFRKTPNGLMGVETIYPFMLTAASDNDISFEKAVEVCSANPARIFGCSNKGSIASGKDADIVIYNPEGESEIRQENMHSTVDYTVWEGMKIKGKIEKTISHGNVIYDGEFLGKKGQGRYVKRVAALKG